MRSVAWYKNIEEKHTGIRPLNNSRHQRAHACKNETLRFFRRVRKVEKIFSTRGGKRVIFPINRLQKC